MFYENSWRGDRGSDGRRSAGGWGASPVSAVPPEPRPTADVWPLDRNTTLALALLILPYVSFLLGWTMAMELR